MADSNLWLAIYNSNILLNAIHWQRSREVFRVSIETPLLATYFSSQAVFSPAYYYIALLSMRPESKQEKGGGAQSAE